MISTIADLPTEMVNEIGTDFEEDDWLALRMTCQKFNSKFRDFHLDSKYTRLRVFLVRQSTRNLVRISEHPSEVNLRVRRLEISFRSPYMPERIFDITYSARAMRISPDRGGNIGSKDKGRRMMSEIKRLASRRRVDSGHMAPEIEAMRLDLLTALSKLPNLQGVRFAAGASDTTLTRSELNLFYPSLQLVPGTRIPISNHVSTKVQMGVYEEMVLQGWNDALSAICATPRPSLQYITWLQIKNNSVSNHLADFPKAGSAFPNLRVLDVAFYPGQGWGKLWGLRFSRWLSSIGPALEELRVIVQGGFERNNQEPIQLPENHELFNLAKLYFSGFPLNPDNLEAFLSHCKGALTELTIARGDMKDPKNGWFKIMKVLNSDFKLQLFQLQPDSHVSRVFELSDDDVSLDGLEPTEPEYLLPNLKVVGGWSSTSTLWQATCWTSGSEFVVCKHFGLALDNQSSPDEFWGLISERRWTDSEILKDYGHEVIYLGMFDSDSEVYFRDLLDHHDFDGDTFASYGGLLGD
ncbi:hypothetical protein TWF730_001636 [Orbilia blumenaviensis]|uniref:F-box domain-containing protein n=1 Tax=Orbilia blumenaviensis TaxID=1796055 RepID=A0AAV9ULP3_9PEZI